MSDINLKEYDILTSDDEIIKACQRVESQTFLSSEGKDLYLNYLTNLSHLKQQKKMLDEQNKFNKSLLNDNKKLINNNKYLVIATWFLAISTTILSLINLFSN